MKRRDTRLKKKLMVAFSEDGKAFEQLGLVNDISKNGLCISSEKELKEHKEVVLSVAVPGAIYTLKGEVMWCKETGENQSGIPDDIGIRITEAPVEYVNFVEYMKHQKIEPGKPEF